MLRSYRLAQRAEWEVWSAKETALFLLKSREKGSEKKVQAGVEGQAEGCGLVKGNTCTGLSIHGIDAGVWGDDVR